jgi:hypothetical protein
MYKLLFDVAWETLNDFGWNKKYLGAQIGTTMVLHTWGSNLSYHPHVHCIVPAGGVTLNNKWKNANGKGKFLFPVKALSEVYKPKFLKRLKQLNIHLKDELVNTLFKKDWVVYAKPPFKNVEVLINYLARYTHKNAITHHRIKKVDKEYVSFSYTDYRHKNKKKVLTIPAWEFVRRLALHFLPKRFCRIRHYGILSSSWKTKLFPNTETIKKNWKEIWLEKGIIVDRCPSCKKGTLIFIDLFIPSRAPPIR